MANILLLAIAWGPKHGGINAFNMDFAQGLVTYLHGAGRVFCAVLDASNADFAEAAARGVTLLSIERSPESASYDRSWAYDVWKRLQAQYPDQTIDWWVGHDVVSGATAVAGPPVARGNRLSELGHYAEALECAQHAERIQRELAQAQPEVYRPNWALSLNNVAEALLLAGEVRHALPSACRAGY